MTRRRSHLRCIGNFARHFFRVEFMRIIRSLLESMTRDWTFRRRLPTAFGRAPIYVSPSCGLRYLFRSMEAVDPVLQGLVREFVRRDAVVWDVGANVGLFSIPAASLAGPRGRVIAFEPDAWLVQLLRRSAKSQSDSNAPVTVVPAAIASTMDIRSFVLANRSRATNYLEGFGTSQAGGDLETVTVISVSLDWLLDHFPPPTLLKIDVEGAELEVLAGASRLLQQVRPTVIIEVGSDSAAEVTQVFHKQKYQLFDGEIESSKRMPVGEATWTTIAIPQ